jgi:hypothetical protein
MNFHGQISVRSTKCCPVCQNKMHFAGAQLVVFRAFAKRHQVGRDLLLVATVSDLNRPSPNAEWPRRRLADTFLTQ